MRFRVKKRICATKIEKDGKVMQFLTSGFPNRKECGTEFSSMDGLWGYDFLQDLKYDECDCENDPNQGIEVMVDISRIHFEGSREMWVAGFKGTSRSMTPYKPENVKQKEDGMSWRIKQGSIYLSTGCDKDYFPDVEEGEVFPVWMRVRRMTDEERTLYSKGPKIFQLWG